MAGGGSRQQIEVVIIAQCPDNQRARCRFLRHPRAQRRERESERARTRERERERERQSERERSEKREERSSERASTSGARPSRLTHTRANCASVPCRREASLTLAPSAGLPPPCRLTSLPSSFPPSLSRHEIAWVRLWHMCPGWPPFPEGGREHPQFQLHHSLTPYSTVWHSSFAYTSQYRMALLRARCTQLHPWRMELRRDHCIRMGCAMTRHQ